MFGKSKDKYIVTLKWIYKIKHAIHGSINKYKARFVAWGFSQQEGIDYDEKLYPLARYMKIRIIISIAASMGWNIH